MPPTQLDPQAVALAKAIRQTESGGDWSAKGGSGEWGAYQFTPGTWDAYASEAGVNAVFGSATPDQQNEVAYKKIKQWKDQGYNPGQIASMWNAGAGKPNAYQEGHKGVNAHGVEYDTPEYAKKVAMAYQSLKGEQATPQTAVPVQEGQKTFTQDAGASLGEAGTKLSTAIGRTVEGEINPLSGIIQSAGAVAGGINDLTSDVLHHIPVVGDVVEGVEGFIGKGVQKLAETDLGKKAVTGYQGFAEQHPELAGNIGAGFEIATAIPVLKGLSAVKRGVGGAVGSAVRGGVPAEMEALAPRVVGKAYQKAALEGKVQGPGMFSGAGIVPEEMKGAQKAFNAVKTASEALGKKPSQIIKGGVGQDTNNLNRLITLGKEYAQKVVSPFVQESGVSYNFTDLKKALELVEPPKGLKGKGLEAWYRMKQSTIDSISNKIGPDVRGITSISEFRKRVDGSEIPKKVLKGDEDFWDARKMIDDIYETETRGKVFGDEALSGAKDGYRDLRAAFKDYLGEAYRYPGQMEQVNRLNEFLRTPQVREMDKTGWNLDDLEKQFGLQRSLENEAKAAQWEQHMETLSGIYDAQKSIATKVGQERGMTKMGAFAKRHPIIRGLVKTGGKAAAEGTGIGAMIKVMD